MGSDVYSDMYLYMTPELFIIEPSGKDELLIIDRYANTTQVQPKKDQLENQRPAMRICGILGTIRLLGSYYLIVATYRICVGVLNSVPIWRLAGHDIIPYIPTTTHLTPQQNEQNEIYLQMVDRTLKTKYFYFSYWGDITRNQQSLHKLNEGGSEGHKQAQVKNGILESADKRFVWNAELLQNFNCPDMNKFQLPLIMGFVSILELKISNKNVIWSIISRRSVKCAGPRLFCRGIRDDGTVANYVETEQILEYLGGIVSFVQTRGSIPLYWRQYPNLRLKPAPEIVPGKEHFSAFKKHFDTELMLYGRIVIVNLVDQKGAEGVLEKAYRTLVHEFSNFNVQYEAFDFHQECKHMRWDRLNILIDHLAEEQDNHYVFHKEASGEVRSTQDGVFRTNCVDCLDRTNVVQCMLAKRSFTEAMQLLGVTDKYMEWGQIGFNFDAIFKNVWADHADVISFQYSGTGALKTDFTRTGKRTILGVFRDGVNSLMRYYINNFADGFRQDAIDLFLGNYVVPSDEGNLLPSPFTTSRGWRYNTFPSVLLFAMAMFFFSAIFPSELNTESLLFLLFWGAMIGVSTSGILHYSEEFVDWPRLFPLTKVEA